MRSLIQFGFLVFVAIFSQSALAEIVGSFESTNEIKVEQEKQIIVVSNVSQRNKQKIKELRGKEFICEKVSRWHKCYKFNKSTQLPAELEIKIPNLNIDFKAITGIRDKWEGELVTTLVVDQNVLISGVLYKGVRYITTSDMIKAKVGIDSHALSPVYFIFKNNQLSQIKNIRWHSSEKVWTEYLVRFLFKNTY